MKNFVAIFTIISSFFVIIGTLFTSGAQTAVAAPAVQIPFPDQRDAVTQAVNWLIANHQNSDGGYSSFSSGAGNAPSDISGTSDALLAIAGSGIYPTETIVYLQSNIDIAIDAAQADGGSAGKLILGLVAAGHNPRDFAGVDFVTILTAQLQEDGGYGTPSPFGHGLALLGLAAADEAIPATAVNWLLDRQAADVELDGSWDDGFGTLGNNDATGMAVMALKAAGIPNDADALVRAAAFLIDTQLESGGWEYAAGFGANANSTAVVVQGLSALGLDFYSVDGPLTTNGSTPMQVLLSFQDESGAFQADFGDGPFPDFFTTIQAIPAITGKPLPFSGRYQSARAAVDCLLTMQDTATGGWEQFAGFGVDAAGTARAMQAIAAVGDNANFALSNLEELTPAYLEFSRGGGIGNIMQGVIAGGGNVYDFSSTNLPLAMNGVLSPTGEYDSTQFGPFAHAEAMLGLLAAAEPVDQTAVSFLLNSQTDGDFGGPDSTGIALQVLGRIGEPMPPAIEVLRATQLADGGWGFEPSNPSSTSEVVQGLIAVGENPFSPAWSKVISGTLASPADTIIAQQGESGCWPNQFGPGEDPFGTVDGILMMALLPVPVAPTPILFDSLEEESEAAEEALDPEPEPTEQVLEPTAVPEIAVEESTSTPTETSPSTVEEDLVAAAAATEEAPIESIESGLEEETGQNDPGRATSSGLPLLLVILALALAGGVSYYMRNGLR